MNNEELTEKIKKLEIRTKEKIKLHENSTQSRALDHEYLSLLSQLKEAYQARDGPITSDSLFPNLSDRDLVQCLAHAIDELTQERNAIIDQFRSDSERFRY